MRATDSIGRATFHHIAPLRGIRPTEREIRWLKHLERHGPQSSRYLHALTSDTHRDLDTSLRQMKKLRAGGFLFCPRQQRATENANFNAYVYDLAPAGRAFLEDEGLAEDTVTPRGHWVHQYMTACITGSIDIAARHAGVDYIPAHRILERSGATLAVEIGRKRLIPDQLFGLDHGGLYRFFCVEADRGTEPRTSTQARKSARSLLEDYRAFIGGKLYKERYGLTAGMLLLCVFSSAARERRFLSLVPEVMGERSAYVLTRTVPEFHAAFRPPALLDHLFDEPWNRSGWPGFRISEVRREKDAPEGRVR
ncbi:replication-relaxation family protein [Albimonas sp. CAU 1670]|uniref:replication-relaxation family protein n=1 Tax=Albimonas sp. CAU 1670 TaxID=3032599 RepID=UPI0023DA059A|nr:replication-relaxation family protein [Albimonas sp. CAU 1670]MDF2233152.1 replication-relaxation family protein [Albimonas sp. CAU 1670]